MHEYYYSPLADYETSIKTLLVSIMAASAALLYLVYLGRVWHRRDSESAISLPNRRVRPRGRWVIGAVIALGMFSTTLVIECFKLAEYKRYSDALAQGRCETVRGVVHVLNMELYNGHTPKEQIRVGDKTFSFSHFEEAPGYHDTLAYNGILAESVCVDLCVLHGRILRIDRSMNCSR